MSDLGGSSPSQKLRLAHHQMYQKQARGTLAIPEDCDGCGQPSSELRWYFTEIVKSISRMHKTAAWLCPSCWQDRDVRSAIKIQKQEMIMMAPRGTFATWLAHQSDRPQNDPIGWLAGAWASFSGPDRPRLSSPVSIGRFLSEHGSDATDWQAYLGQAVEAATIAYRAAAESPAGEQQLSLPADDASAAEGPGADQLTDALADHGGPQLPFIHMAADAAEQADADRTADISVIMAMLGQLQAQLGLIMQMLAVSHPAAAELLLSNLATDAEPMLPPSPPVSQPDGDFSQNLAHEIAERNGWLAQPPAMTGGFETWWNAADPAGDAGS